MSAADTEDFSCGGARWAEAVVAVFVEDGYQILRTAGSNDYQGSGCLLAMRGDCEWAVYTWSYGSCGGCDRWEDSPGDLATDVRAEREIFHDGSAATARYEEMVSQIW